MNKDKKVQVVMLATNKSNIGIKHSKVINYRDIPYIKTNTWQPQNLYFLSDDEIKEGDWYIIEDKELAKATSAGDIIRQFKDCKKIIASTDKSLGLPQPSKEWIEYFVSEYNKGNIITEVMVEYEIFYYNCSCSKSDHFDECDKDCKESILSEIKVNSDNTINIKSVEETWRDFVNKMAKHFGFESNNDITEEQIKWAEENYQVPKQLNK